MVALQLRRDPPNAPFDLPDALTVAPWAPEQRDIVGVRLRVITQDQAQERGLPGTVGAQERPLLTPAHGPGDIVQDGKGLGTTTNAAQLDDGSAARAPDSER